jgi:hypothetical protein
MQAKHHLTFLDQEAFAASLLMFTGLFASADSNLLHRRLTVRFA